jgi:hypothetical protein
MRTLLLIIMLLAISTLASAQGEFWHFAYDQTKGQIIAYTVNGEAVPLGTVAPKVNVDSCCVLHHLAGVCLY